jgi:hypothetical protein
MRQFIAIARAIEKAGYAVLDELAPRTKIGGHHRPPKCSSPKM